MVTARRRLDGGGGDPATAKTQTRVSSAGEVGEQARARAREGRARTGNEQFYVLLRVVPTLAPLSGGKGRGATGPLVSNQVIHRKTCKMGIFSFT